MRTLDAVDRVASQLALVFYKYGLNATSQTNAAKITDFFKNHIYNAKIVQAWCENGMVMDDSGWLPSGYVKIAIENGHRNSGFSH